MARRHKAIRRAVTPDAVYNSDTISRLVNVIMERGKKSTAEQIVCDICAWARDNLELVKRLMTY